MRRLLFISLILFPFIASAQQPQSSPGEQALNALLTEQINARYQCLTSLVGQNQQVATLQARIKELEDKLPKDEKPK